LKAAPVSAFDGKPVFAEGEGRSYYVWRDWYHFFGVPRGAGDLRLDARLREDERLHEVAPDIRTREIIFKRAFVLRLIVAARLWMMSKPMSAAGTFAVATS
jgi:hypothetical protein